MLATLRQCVARSYRIQNLESNLRAFSQYSKVYPSAFLHKAGDHPYGSRRYLLVEHAHGDSNDQQEYTSFVPGPNNSQLRVHATLCANRNIVFGASVVDPSSDLFGDALSPLLQSALPDCYSVGEQPQALATLHGLSSYVQRCLKGEIASEYLQSVPPDEIGQTILEAVKAVATGVPRTGHTVVGKKTHEVAADAWESLAKEFVNSEAYNCSGECQLYQKAGAQLVGIDLLADTSPEYLASAGGAMARFFFV